MSVAFAPEQTTSEHAKLDALARRYGQAQIPPVGPWNAHIDLLMSHRSVRGYRADPVPEGTLETLIAAAQSAATSSNLQTWSVVAVTDPAKKAEFAKIAGNQKHIEQCPLFLVWLADLSRNERLGAEEGVDLASLPYLETFLVAAVDAALAAQNATVAAESVGLSTVYIGALRNDPIKVGQLLDLPSGTMGVFGLCVGYADPNAANEVKPRLPQSVVLHHETYGTSEERTLRAEYDAEMAAFSRRNEMAADSWTQRVVKRMATLAAMNGRDKLSEIVKAMGFHIR
jgi:nitroreductase